MNRSTAISLVCFAIVGVAFRQSMGDSLAQAADAASEKKDPMIQSVSFEEVAETIGKETLMGPEPTKLVRSMALMLLPLTYSDDDDWGAHKRIQSGLNVKVDGLKVKTSRRWKEVRHGTWQRVDASLIDPDKHFQLAVSFLPKTEPGVPRFRVKAKARLRAVGRQQQWNLGAKLYSISADVLADVEFNADLHFRTDIVQTDGKDKIRMLPHIETASARLESFSLRGVSHVKGGAMREFGKVVESIIQRAVKKKGEKLTTKINLKIQKKPERFEIPAGILVIFAEKPSVKEPSVN